MDDNMCNSAVIVDEAYKRYGRTVVLRGLNMTVPKGTIYGLLGPSGCGKTTLLSCMVSLNNLDSGSIKLCVNSKSKIGYMSQELGLYTEFSIWETLSYFGWVYGMDRKSILRRVDELLEFLDLPEKSRVLSKLSGGQQRRVSLCTALLHNPELLILDEPTVGIDPVLSHHIWEKLKYMSNVEKKTIVITTHYIEEARSAQTIGLMRGGVLLAEDNPEALISLHNCTSLEQVFLNLSHRQAGETYIEETKKSLKLYPKPTVKPSPAIAEERLLRWRRVEAQILKFCYWMKHNIPIMCFLLFLPFVQCLLFNLSFGLDPIGLKMAVVNDEMEDWSSQCSQSLSNLTCGHPHLSCLYLDKLRRKQLNLVNYGSVLDAQEGVRTNAVWGVIHFESNYSYNIMSRYGDWIRATDQAVDGSTTSVWLDMSNQYIGNLIKWDLYRCYIDFVRELFTLCGWPPKAGDIPISFQEAVYGGNNPAFIHFAVPAILQLFEFYLPMMFTVGALITERRIGAMERGQVAGITMLETFVSHVLVQFSLLLVQTATMLVVMFVMFDNPFHGSFILCSILLFLIGVNGTCYGIFVGVFCHTDISALYMGLGSFFPLAMLSGMIWPCEGMHSVLRSVAYLLPLTLTTESMRSILIRSWGLTHPVVYSGFISVSTWIAMFCVVITVYLKYINKSLKVIS